jgi:hypothetical protein
MKLSHFNADNVNSFFQSANSSKLLIGISMIIFNIGSKFLVIDMSKTQEQFFKNVLMRRITLFCIFFVATRDIFISLILTASFVILAYGLFNESSKFYILPKNSFYDNIFTKEEYEISKKIIRGYEKENIIDDSFCKNN